MRPVSKTCSAAAVLALAFAFPVHGGPAASQAPPRPGDGTFQVDPHWPQDLPGDWLLGNVVGVAVDSGDNVWIIHRPNSQRGGEADGLVYVCDRGNQRIQVFDRDGTFVKEALVDAPLAGGQVGGYHGTSGSRRTPSRA